MKTAKQSGHQCEFVPVLSPLKDCLLRKPMFMIILLVDEESQGDQCLLEELL